MFWMFLMTGRLDDRIKVGIHELLRVMDFFENQPLRRGQLARSAAAAGGQDPGDFVLSPFTPTHLRQGPHHVAHHVVKEPVGLNVKDSRIVLPIKGAKGHIAEVVVLFEGSRLAEACEIVGTQKCRRTPIHDVTVQDSMDVPGVWTENVPHPDDPVAVAPGSGRVAGVEGR